jgi:hypothetical protein
MSSISEGFVLRKVTSFAAIPWGWSSPLSPICLRCPGPRFGFGYDNLEGIADDGAGSAAFPQLASNYLTVPDEIDHLRTALLAYCQRDSLAMVEVHRALTRLALP